MFILCEFFDCHRILSRLNKENVFFYFRCSKICLFVFSLYLYPQNHLIAMIMVDLMIGMVVVLLTDKRLTSYRNSANSRYVRIAAIDIEVLYETFAYSGD